MGLAAFRKALQDTREVEITVTGRTSGREISNPVWFVQEGDKLYLLPVRGSDGDWYRNVVKTPALRLAAEGTEYSTRAAPITDTQRVGDVVERFRAKYGAKDIRAYYSKLDVAVEVALA